MPDQTQAPIQQLAMLASLNISMWTARKYDRKVTQEATRSHAADEDAGRFNKLLVPKEAIAPLEQAAGAARREHEQWTLPWGNNGERLLPGEKFMDYTAAMKLHRTEFWKRFAAFEQEYPTLKANARRLGSMYDPRDFPDQIRDKFAFEISFLPVPNVDDFRVNLSKEAVEQLKADAIRTVETRVQDAVKSVYERARQIVGKIHEQTSNKDRKIYDSSIENAERFVDLLPALNLTKDPILVQVEQEIRALLVPAERLRKSPTTRKAVASAAGNVLQRLG